jgi:hypothetical protein
MTSEAGVLYAGPVANGQTLYVPVPVRNGTIGAQVGWLDATSSATVTLELSSFPGAAATVAGAAHEWKDSGLTITGPAGVAAGSTLVNVENCRQRNARFKIVGAAASMFDIRDGTGP